MVMCRRRFKIVEITVIEIFLYSQQSYQKTRKQNIITTTHVNTIVHHDPTHRHYLEKKHDLDKSPYQKPTPTRFVATNTSTTEQETTTPAKTFCFPFSWNPIRFASTNTSHYHPPNSEAPSNPFSLLLPHLL